jgi:hypothetical protein
VWAQEGAMRILYMAEINGEEVRVHAMNMKPEDILTARTTLERLDKIAERKHKGGGASAPKTRKLTAIEEID